MNTSYFPFKHLVLVALLSVGMVTFVAAQFIDDGDAARFNGDLVLENLSLPDQHDQLAQLTVPGSSSDDVQLQRSDEISEALKPDNLAPPAPRHFKHVEEVRSGDNLSNIFNRQALSPTVLHRVMQSGPLSERLTQIFPGHRLTFTTTEDNQLVRLEYSAGPLETLQFDRDGENYVAKAVSREPQLSLIHI